ncbi:Hypothetical protein NTJ_14412 [Nesidiocoris tenuis]|uniref:Serpin domain-containing protein n=1 Tax=Nesidiocoris tenuis TaxID=355587 RepID=A0ABN7BEJ5_9HEMI|nr:Hypothetical protein NTJ_14412 [Nesidiocoris tenuis]
MTLLILLLDEKSSVSLRTPFSDSTFEIGDLPPRKEGINFAFMPLSKVASDLRNVFGTEHHGVSYFLAGA